MHEHWALDPLVTFLNHGSFGACPRAVLAGQQALRARLEAEPVRFFIREYEPLLDATRETLGLFLGAAPADLVFVPNATTGVNTVLRSLRFQDGDELIVTNHEYPASRNALAAAAGPARLVVAQVPFPLSGPGDVLDAVLAQVTPRTRLVLIDHVTSQTGLIFPVAALAAALPPGVEVLVDGAHAPGMIALDIASLGVTYYTGNCHKWMCAPKGAAFLWVREDRRAAIHPLVVSHGATSTRSDRSRFHLEFDWTGSHDPSPVLSIGLAIHHVGGLLDGWDAVRAHNHGLALEARDMLCAALEIAPPAPGDMLGSMATLPLPREGAPVGPPYFIHPLQEKLYQRGFEVPIVHWHDPPRLIRISAQLYNRREQYVALAETLAELLRAE